MNKTKSLVFVVIAVTLTLAFLIFRRPTAQAGADSSVPYQGQNVGRYQMFFSPNVRADTFVVDSVKGTVYQQIADKDGNTSFQTVPVSPPPVATTSQVGRFCIYFSPNVRADTFLFDTMQGAAYQMVKNPNGDIVFEARGFK